MLEEGVLWVVRRRCAPDFKGKKKLCSGGLEKKLCSGGLEKKVYSGWCTLQVRK